MVRDLIRFCVAGALAKAILAGAELVPEGSLTTIALGIGGSLLVAMEVRLSGYPGTGNFIPAIIHAASGAIVICSLMRRFGSSPAK